jgi:hypothetical protein
MTAATGSATHYRTAPIAAAFVSFILVLAFGNGAFHDWANRQDSHTASGLFWQTLTWPTWHINGSAPVQNLIADDLKAILLIIFTFIFVHLLIGASGRGIRQFISGWAGYIFAAAVAGLLAAWLLERASLYNALLWAVGGAAYGLIVGWIIGLATFAARR